MLVMDYALNYLLMPLFFNFVGRNMKMVTMKILVSLSLEVPTFGYVHNYDI